MTIKSNLALLVTLVSVFCLFFITILSVQAQEVETPITFPEDANFIDIKRDYGAVGDGVTDDTAAIQAALRDHNISADTTLGRFSPRTIYFPPGTYLVTDSLETADPQTGELKNAIRILGAGTEHTTIKLADDTGGFRTGEKALIRMGNEFGKGNSAYGNYIEHITINTGSDNRGATAIDYQVANSGAINHVNIVSEDGAGRSGIYFGQEPIGSGLVKNVSVDGFDYGIRFRRIANSVNNIVLENIYLENQNINGILNDGKNIQILSLETMNTPVPIRNRFENAALVLVDATLRGKGSGPAVLFEDRGFFYGRDIDTRRVDNIVTVGSEDYFDGDRDLVEWSTDPYYVGHEEIQFTENETEYHSLNLPIKETPEYHSNDFSDWVSVADFSGSDSEKFQAAIDSGAEVIYVPYDAYTIDEEVVVRGNVKKIDFMFSLLEGGTDGGAFTVDAVSGDFVILENMSTNHDIEHNSNATVVLRNIGAGPITDITTGPSATGDLFMENIGPHPLVNLSADINVWIRQLNRERRPFTNSGATVWNFGENNEFKPGPRWGQSLTTNGGMTEIIGGAVDIQKAVVTAAEGPFVRAEDSEISVVMAGQVYTGDGGVLEHVIKDSDGSNTVNHYDDWLVTIDLPNDRTKRIAIPLYASADNTAPAPVRDLVVESVTSNTATVTWTAPGDSGDAGQASSYSFRYSTEPITGSTWRDATNVPQEPTPQIAGSAESFTMSGLEPGTTYYVRFKTRDASDNISTLSNEVLFTTADAGQAASSGLPDTTNLETASEQELIEIRNALYQQVLLLIAEFQSLIRAM